ncbi:hypothetical protein JOD54_003418 [Actinokineospora baliensis]|uniref:hypothetical protein n=1 Tax=Actinokineospora baliensis TaxID=547056 RepID=UPI00195E7109|nr:hypothetical protein [Actinokineospora baliensis]MBM7773214.1 hypothetical protein [Actinokineospora baliensis]
MGTPARAGRWDTVAPQRRVLVVVRTPAALLRLQDALGTVVGDPRVEVVFTVDTGSVFSAGLTERLVDSGALVVPWARAGRDEFDLAVAASDNSDLRRFAAPLVLMPHGAGYHRRSTSDPAAISGLRASALVAGGRVLPRAVVVAHPRQVAALASVDPRLAGHAVVATDPCLDRITASEPHRPHHRRHFDAEGRRVVLLCSTWGRHSLLGTNPGLAEELVTSLPVDEYRVAMTLHPNVWQRHGPLQVRAWLRPAVEAGLVLIPPTEDWRPGLLAADVVVSDHGSVTAYAAAAGRPVLLAADGGPEVVPHSPLADLLSTLPRLPADGVPDDLPAPAPRSVTDAVFHPGPTTVDQVFYELMGLPVARPTVTPVPRPRVDLPQPSHYRTTVTQAHLDGGRARLAIARTTGRWSPGWLSTADTTTDIALLEAAAVVWTTIAADDGTHARDLLARYPAARLVTAVGADGTTRAWPRVGPAIAATSTTTPSATAAALHWWTTLAPAQRPHRIDLVAGAASGVIDVHIE